MGVGPQKCHKDWKALFGLASFKKKIVQSYWSQRCLVVTGSAMFTFYCAGLLWYHVEHTFLYTNPVTLYYSENVCTNQEATSTSDRQAVNACTCARISQPTTVP